MRSPLRLIVGALLAGLALTGCGSDAEPVDTTAAGVPVGSLPDGSAVATGAAPTTPAGTASDGTAQAGPVQIDVVVGRDDAPTRVERVVVGADLTLNITNPDAADEFHVHGIDLERAVDAGVMATFNFTVDMVGSYEVESHETGTVLVVIEVTGA